MARIRRITSFSSWKAASTHAEAMVPAKAPTLMNPAWPRLSSPEIPTVRFRETAMTTYTQMGTSWPRRERDMAPALTMLWQMMNATMTMP